MRFLTRSLLCGCASLALLGMAASSVRAQDRMNDGLAPGDYLRVSAGSISPAHPQGSLRDWDRGTTIGVNWEGWQGGSGGPGLVGFGIGADYSRLPLNSRQFLADFTPPAGGSASAASASSATAFSLETTLRVRIPSPFIMPSLSVAFGYLDFHPSTVTYTASSGGGTATQQHRRGAAFTFGAGLDKHVAGKFGVFGEALYTYGLTSLGQGIATPGGTCSTNGCDVLKNTTLGTVRGGLRLQIGN